MTRFALLGAFAALAACAQPADEAAVATETPTAATTISATPVAWTGFEPGSYTVTGPTGNTIDFVLTADSYTATMPDGATETGKLALKEGKGCMTPEGGAERCYTNAAPNPDGSWVSTDAAGEKSTVVKKPA